MPSKGFTFVEILITLSLLAVLFVPAMQLFSHAMEGAGASRDLITAVSLAKWEMERAKNLGASTERLWAEGDTVFPPPEEPALSLNGRLWRVHRHLKMEGAPADGEPETVVQESPVEVTVEVFREEVGADPRVRPESKPLARLATLITDFTWEQRVS